MATRFTILPLAFILVCITYLTYQSTSSYAANILATVTTGLFVPLTPLNLAVSINDSGVDLSWSTPYSNGGSEIIDYIVEYRLSSGGSWVVSPDSVSSTTVAEVIHLTNDTSYDFRVSAVNVIGEGAPSAMVTATPGAPAQVLISSMSDLTTPTITSLARITNEGTTAYEYQYTWCVTNSDVNLCGGGDDVFTSSAAKLIQPSENWDTTLPATVSVVGNYWFHLQVSFGSDTSYARQSFTAVRQSGGGGGGGGGGGKVRACVGGDMNRDSVVNLIDFSILLISFNRLPPFQNSCTDINRDGKVNVVDFSILLTQWGKKPVVYKQIL